MADEPNNEQTTDTTTTADTETSTNETVATTADDKQQADTSTDAKDDASKGTVLGDDVSDDDGDGDDNTDDTAAGPPPEGEDYSLSLKDAEGNEIALDPEMVKEADPVFRELGLSNDQANKLLPLAVRMQENAQDATLKHLGDLGEQQKKAWLDEAKADEEIGGKKWADTEHLAAKGMDALGFTKGHPFRIALTETGFGNHPDMIRAMRKVGEAVGEDGIFARSGEQARTQPKGWDSLYKDTETEA